MSVWHCKNYTPLIGKTACLRNRKEHTSVSRRRSSHASWYLRSNLRLRSHSHWTVNASSSCTLWTICISRSSSTTAIAHTLAFESNLLLLSFTVLRANSNLHYRLVYVCSRIDILPAPPPRFDLYQNARLISCACSSTRI